MLFSHKESFTSSKISLSVFFSLSINSLLFNNSSNLVNVILSKASSKSPILIHGVTASGKTEVYFKLIKDTLSSGKNVLFFIEAKVSCGSYYDLSKQWNTHTKDTSNLFFRLRLKKYFFERFKSDKLGEKNDDGSDTALEWLTRLGKRGKESRKNLKETRTDRRILSKLWRTVT